MDERLRVQPERAEFERLSAAWPLVPVWAELLADVATPVGLFHAVAGDGPGILLESVERSERWGRYSFVAGDPAAVVVVDGHGARLEDPARALPTVPAPDADPRAALTSYAQTLRGPRLPDLPPIAGGLMGMLAYEAAGLLNGHPAPLAGEAPCPPISLLVIDRAVVFDHWRQRIVLVAHATAGGYDDAIAALERLADRVAHAEPLPLAQMGPPPEDPAGLGQLSMPDERYRQTVATFKEHILAGDIYQGVPSRRVSFAAPGGGFPIYRRLRVTNPAPYMFFLRMRGLELAGPRPSRSYASRAGACRPVRSPGHVRGARPRCATVSSSTSCSPTRRSRPSTRCSWTWRATTSGGCAPRAASARPS